MLKGGEPSRYPLENIRRRDLLFEIEGLDDVPEGSVLGLGNFGKIHWRIKLSDKPIIE
jgi:hypothetical protein